MRGGQFNNRTGPTVRPRSVSPTPNSQNQGRTAPFNSAAHNNGSRLAAGGGGLRQQPRSKSNNVSNTTSPVPGRQQQKPGMTMNNNNARNNNLYNGRGGVGGVGSSTSRRNSAENNNFPSVATAVIQSMQKAVNEEKMLLKNAEDAIPQVENQIEEVIEQRDFELEQVHIAHQNRCGNIRDQLIEGDDALAHAQKTLQDTAQALDRLEEDIILGQNRIRETQEEGISNARRRIQIRCDTLAKKQTLKEEEAVSLEESLKKEQDARDDTSGLSEDGKHFLKGARQFYVDRERIKEETAGLEMRRRELFSTYEELKGTIRVYCRVKGIQNSNELEEVNRFMTFPDHGSNNNNNDQQQKPSSSTSSRTTSNSNNKNKNSNTKNTNTAVNTSSSSSSAASSSSSSNNNNNSSGCTLEITSTRENATSTGKRDTQTSFTYDRVFGISATQSQIFEDVAGLVDCAVDGYKVCIFASGQTGSGKTYTMEGTETNPGLIPRAINRVFERAQSLNEDGWKYYVKCSFLEIYNEQIRNLLETSTGYHRTFFENKGNGNNGKPLHEIVHHGKTDTTVSGINEVFVEKPADVHKLLVTASKNRSVAATNMNDRSSRSHSVFTMRIEGHSDKINNGTTTTGILCLVDLAGSERVNESGAQGQRMKEAIAINQSLSFLGECINSMGRSQSVVSWRNCKLTYMLQNFLSGDGAKMLMFVNVSNKEEHVPETLNSLRFAAKVNVTQIGQAKKRIS